MPGFKKQHGAPGARKGGPKSGSRSPGHRGYRAEEAVVAPKKQRWTTEDRAARQGYGSRDAAGAGTGAGAGAGRKERPNWEPRGKDARTWEARGERGAARTGNGDRPARGERPAYGDRPARGERGAYGDRPARSFDKERPARSFDGDRAPRRDDNDRPRRSYDNDRPARSFDNDRPARSFDGDRAPRGERPAYGDRPARSFDKDRPARSFDKDRPARSFDKDRPARSFDGDRAPRGERAAYGDRPARSFDKERPARSFDGARAPRRDDNDRPRRSFDNDRAPSRDFGADRPARSFDNDRPRRSFGDRGDRAPRRDNDSKFYPNRDEKAAFTPDADVVLDRLEADAIQAKDVEGVTFGDLGIGGNIERALADLGAATPFPIQAATIPDVLAGKDVLGRGRTGSGKTIAFGAPLVERLMTLWTDSGKSGGKRQLGRKPRALILAPTRELALQIDRTVQPIARSVGLFTTQIYGGVPQARQVGALQRGVDIVIGTPGRIEDLIEQGRLDLSEVVITVLDEADHMCDLGFLEPVQRILRETAEGGQKLLFSATLDKGVAQLVEEFLPEPSVHEVAGEDQASSTIDHRVLVIEHRDKGAIIEQLADREGKTLVFARTRAFAEMLAEQLDDAGIPAVSLHGDLNQSRRTRNLAQLTSGRVNVLVATDVAARGIHVDDIGLVIQADAPDEYKTYLHRSGRTGRAGKQGMVVTLIPRQRQRRMTDLLDRAEIQADFVPAIPGDQLITDLAQAGA
ncbi:MAG: DEAD/DEAH box helicase [Leifsonia sp.]